ncbi:hypothetical protein C6499_02500 [Candidatus Poribacteria bacterium]|nr:MAG: hypothetical protein C6499_02500 [Candidatus Poribacteria bacterium]
MLNLVPRYSLERRHVKMRRIVSTLLFGLTLSIWHIPHSTSADEIVFLCLLRADAVGGESAICTVNPNGGEPRILTKKPKGAFKKWPTLSPDRTKIFFVTHGENNLYLMDADGGNVTLLKEDYRGERPAWSPDGKQIAYGGTGPWIAIFDVHTLKEKLMFVPVDQAYDIAWSPDGRQLAFVNWNRDQQTGRDIYAINVDGTDLQQLTDHPGHDRWPAWAPNGRQIAFYSTRNENSSGISLIDIEGNNLRELTDGGEIYPSWSPDGKQMAFWVWDGNAHKAHIGVMDAGGHHLKLIAEGRYPSWQSTFPRLAVHPIDRLTLTWGQIKSGNGFK